MRYEICADVRYESGSSSGSWAHGSWLIVHSRREKKVAVAVAVAVGFMVCCPWFIAEGRKK